MKRSGTNWSVLFMVGLGGLMLLALAGCGGGEESPPPRPPPPNLSGVWAGSWAGTDPVAGAVNGNWEAEISQTDAGVLGTAHIGGDVDCSDGGINGTVGSDNIPRGTLSRTPCEQNNWELTSLIPDGMQAAGTWSQPSTGASGRLRGQRVATTNGPRIRFFSPPGGGPGTLVTLVAERLAANETDNQVSFGTVGATAKLQLAPRVLNFRVPNGAGMGLLDLKTPLGEALSPRTFNTSASYPAAVLSNQYAVGASQQGIAVSPDDRRVYVAANNASLGEYAIKMLDAADGEVLVTTSLGTTDAVQGIVASPDGRWVYAANGLQGVRILHATTNSLVKTLAIPCGDGSHPSPQGIAVTPDGELLLAADSVPGGTMSLVDIASGQVLDSYSPGADFIPVAAAVSPDDQRALLLFDSTVGPGELVIYELADGSLTASIPVGNGPLGLAVTPDASMAFVSNSADASVTAIDMLNPGLVATTQVGILPAGLAVSPDGSRLYLAGRGTDSMQVLDTATGSLLSSVAVLGEPQAIAISADGKSGYLSHNLSHAIAHVGGTRLLTMEIQGPGLAYSSPAGIHCGGNCQTGFDFGSEVILHADANRHSAFVGWSGHADCFDGRVTMDSDKICRAEFIEVPPVYGCFIATATFGSFLEPEVQALRDFRDRYMLTNTLGRSLNQLYMDWSPPLAAFIQRHPSIKLGTRIALIPVVYAIKYPLLLVSLFGVMLAVLLLGRSRKRRAS